MNEQKILSVLKQNKKIGQKVLFEFFYAKMLSISLRYMGNKEDAEDALAESFVRIFKNLEKFNLEKEGGLERWIKTITIRESLRILQKRKKLIYDDNILTTEIIDEAEIGESIDMEYVLKEIQSMPEGYRTVLYMHCIENYSHKEIAEILDIAISTSKSQLRKARNFLIKKIKKENLYEFRRN